jgi:heterodisulfide reductase subunit C
MTEVELQTLIPGGSSFLEEVNEKSEQHIQQCYQCQKCSVGCPVVFKMDYAPNQIMRMVQMGLLDEVLRSRTIWVCASCETCSARCPNEIDIARVMDSLRQLAVAKKARAAISSVKKFHKIFLVPIKLFGREHEATMMGLYKTATGSFFEDMGAGLKMFLKGKIGILPSSIKGKKEVREIFDRFGPK